AGSVFYLLETLLEVADDVSEEAHYHLHEATNAIRRQFARHYGHDDGFPARGDPQDAVYRAAMPAAALPVAAAPEVMPRGAVASLRARAKGFWYRGARAFGQRRYALAVTWLTVAAALWPPLVWDAGVDPTLRAVRKVRGQARLTSRKSIDSIRPRGRQR